MNERDRDRKEMREKIDKSRRSSKNREYETERVGKTNIMREKYTNRQAYRERDE